MYQRRTTSMVNRSEAAGKRRLSCTCTVACTAILLVVGHVSQASDVDAVPIQLAQRPAQAGHFLEGRWTEVRNDGRPAKSIIVQANTITETVNGIADSGTIRVNGQWVTFSFAGSDTETFGFRVVGNGNRVNFTHPLTGLRIRRFHWVRPAGFQPPNQMPPNEQPPPADVQPPQTPNNPPPPPPVNPPPVNPAPPPPPANSLLAEARKAAEYLNRVRANPAAFVHLHPSLAQVPSKPPLEWNDALHRAAQRKARWMADTGQIEHVMNIGGQTVGMNQWMREAGYQLVDALENSQSNFENLYADSAAANIGTNTIDTFLREGKDGGHVKPILGREFWGSCKHIGVGIATAPNGMNFVSLLVGAYNPWDPNETPPRAQNPPPQNPPPGPNPPPPGGNAPPQNPIPPPNVSPQSIAFTVENQSRDSVIVTYQDNRIARTKIVSARKSETLSVDHGSDVKYRTPISRGRTMALSNNRTLIIPDKTAVVTVVNTRGTRAVVRVRRYLRQPSETGEFILARGGRGYILDDGESRRLDELPLGTVVRVFQIQTGRSISRSARTTHTVTADATISFP